jgi:hypothetical protein
MIDGGKVLIIRHIIGQQKMAQKIEHGYCGYLTCRRMVFNEVQALNYGDVKSLG